MRATLCAGLLLLLVATVSIPAVQAQDTTGQEQVPPMGPPPQMKKLASLEGVWNVSMQWRSDAESDIWEQGTATAIYRFVAGGAALQMDYESQWMNMPYSGTMLQCFDRETNMWQSVWTDNVGARISLYTGEDAEDRIVVSGEDKYAGKTMWSRVITENFTDTSFDWIMQQSYDGGQTYHTLASARYSKRQEN